MVPGIALTVVMHLFIFFEYLCQSKTFTQDACLVGNSGQGFIWMGNRGLPGNGISFIWRLQPFPMHYRSVFFKDKPVQWYIGDWCTCELGLYGYSTGKSYRTVTRAESIDQTGYWKRPLQRAVFVILVPVSMQLQHLSYPADTVFAKDKYMVYRVFCTDLMPDRDLIFSWN